MGVDGLTCGWMGCSLLFWMGRDAGIGRKRSFVFFGGGSVLVLVNSIMVCPVGSCDALVWAWGRRTGFSCDFVGLRRAW